MSLTREYLEEKRRTLSDALAFNQYANTAYNRAKLDAIDAKLETLSDRRGIR